MLKVNYILEPMKNYGNHIKPKKRLKIAAAAAGAPEDSGNDFDLNKLVKKPFSKELIAAAAKLSEKNKISRDEYFTNYTKNL